ncbi:MAG: hypothetical protein QRY74_06260 [Chlamydia sp.]
MSSITIDNKPVSITSEPKNGDYKKRGEYHGRTIFHIGSSILTSISKNFSSYEEQKSPIGVQSHTFSSESTEKREESGLMRKIINLFHTIFKKKISLEKALETPSSAQLRSSSPELIQKLATDKKFQEDYLQKTTKLLKNVEDYLMQAKQQDFRELEGFFRISAKEVEIQSEFKNFFKDEAISIAYNSETAHVLSNLTKRVMNYIEPDFITPEIRDAVEKITDRLLAIMADENYPQKSRMDFSSLQIAATFIDRCLTDKAKERLEIAYPG